MAGCFFKKLRFKSRMIKFMEDLTKSVAKLTLEVNKMANELKTLQDNVAALIATVTAEGDVVRSAVIAIKGLTEQQAALSEQLQQAIDNSDPSAIQAAADAIMAQNQLLVENSTKLAEAIPAGTPAEPPAVG